MVRARPCLAVWFQSGRGGPLLPRRLYECDLGHSDDLPVSRQNRGNIWALHGLAECLRRLGDPQAEDAAAALAAAMPLADQAITSSCFCRGRYL